MLEIADFQVEPVRLDLSSAGLGQAEIRQLRSGVIRIANALAFVEFEENPTQLIACEQCGTPGCGGGNYVALRRYHGGLLLMPAFEAMSAGDWELTVFAPPYYLEQHGSLFFPADVYDALRGAVPGFPHPASLPDLNPRDTLSLLQWEGPLEVLGRFPDPPSIRSNLLLAVSEGDLEAEVARLGRVLDGLNHRRWSVEATASPSLVTFHLDGPGFPEWSPFGETADGSLVLHPAGAIYLRVGSEPVDRA